MLKVVVRGGSGNEAGIQQLPEGVNLELSTRFGLGTDRHRLQPGDGLVLAGVKIPCAVKALAHSDGDAVLHAVADAILGAAGGADIGELFSNEDPQWKDLDSAVIVAEACRWALDQGWKPVQVDVVIHLEKPKLAEHRTVMRDSLARLLNISVDAVGLKAKTGEGLGPVGEGLAIDTMAVIQLQRAGGR